MKTLHKYDTVRHADSVEFCPHVPHQNIFVCGNYELVEETKESQSASRAGRILLFSLTKQDGLELLQTIETAGVLDQKWCHNQVNGASVLGVANAERSIEIYKLIFDEELRKVRLAIVTKFAVSADPNALILSLDFSTGKLESNVPEIVCSDSNGCLHRLIFEDDKLRKVKEYSGHKFEAWIAAYDYWDTQTFFSGGDDCLFLKYDTRMDDNPIVKNKVHQAGVTSIHSNVKREHLLATGSYDTCLRLWDARKLKFPLIELHLPGTLWRLKWDPFDANYLLAGCMLGGAHVVKVENNRVDVISSYKEHENLVYGVDWCHLDENQVSEFEGNSKFLIGTCSFYDHLLCLSTLDVNKKG